MNNPANNPLGTLLHWTLLLWIAPIAATCLWVVWACYPSMPSSTLMNVVWLGVIGASLVSPVVAGVYWLTRLKDLRAALALLVNVGGLGIDAVGIMLAAGHAAG